MLPLPALRVFMAVHKAQNFTRAAKELHMTQAAVSYHIRQLETYMDGALCVRQARGVRLTALGQKLAPLIQQALTTMDSGVEKLRHAEQKSLTISTIATLAGNWLGPRLADFQQQHPDITVQLEISHRKLPVGLHTDHVDVMIRSGTGDWPGLTSHYLMNQSFTAMCSPAYLQREGRPHSPQDLLHHVLIAPGDVWWPIWFKACGMAPHSRSQRIGIEVETQHMSAVLAATGAGIALLSPAFATADLAAGRLLPLFDFTVESGQHYDLLYPPHMANQPKVTAFRDWIIAQARTTMADMTRDKI